MAFLRDLKNLLTTGSRNPGGKVIASDRDVDNLDAAAAAAASHVQVHEGSTSSAGPSYPPGYVNEYDEGRPRK
jgi:hypothetical protein